MTTRDSEVVTALEQAIAQRVGERRYLLWFEGKTRYTWENGQLLVGVRNRFCQEWLESKFTDEVRAAAGEVLGLAIKVRFVIDAELFQAAREVERKQQPPKIEDRGPRTTETPTPSEKRKTKSDHRPRRWRRLADFVVGPCNRLAHSLAVSVVEAPGQGANPLVLYGSVGTGKTHLLEGIYAGLRQAHPEQIIRYATAEQFTNRFVEGMHLGKMGAFRKHFREGDALLLDDLHFLATKRKTQEEFLHTFDALLAEGKQIVVSCDSHPRGAEDFCPELTDRLLGGLVGSLLPPDAGTRQDLLRAKSVSPGESPVPDAVLRFLAGELHGNVRELEGAMHSLRHFARVAGRPVDMALAREALGDLLRHTIRVVQLADIDRAVCAVLRLEAGALQSKQRVWAVSRPRMLALYLARKHTTAAYSEIGQHFGGLNHSTVLAAEKKVRKLFEADGELLLGDRALHVREIIGRIEHALRK